jgi:large subunit ribosomal protein L18
MKGKKTVRAARLRRHERVRERVVGTPQRPRLCVFRSLKHIYAQIIDDQAGRTLVAASDLETDIRAPTDGKKPARSKKSVSGSESAQGKAKKDIRPETAEGKAKKDVAGLVGGLLARRALERGIKMVVFDRGGYRFHGRVKALAEAARETGLEF